MFLHTPPSYTGRVEVKLHSFLSPPPVTSEWSAPMPRSLYPEEMTLDIHWMGACLGSTARLHVSEDIYIYLFTANGLLPGGSGYFTRKQNMKLVTTRFNSGGLHEKHVVATWVLGIHLSICL